MRDNALCLPRLSAKVGQRLAALALFYDPESSCPKTAIEEKDKISIKLLHIRCLLTSCINFFFSWLYEVFTFRHFNFDLFRIFA